MGRTWGVLLLTVNVLAATAMSTDAPFAVRELDVDGPLVALPVPVPEGYEYGRRGSHMQSATVISSLEIQEDGAGQQRVCIRVMKGPGYAACDPETNGYPGCTLLGALVGDFFEDCDSAQVVLMWKDRQGVWHFADNLAKDAGTTPGHRKAAEWVWADPHTREAVCTWFPIGKEAVELTALMLYTDVCYWYTEEFGPEDGPAVFASWDARRQYGQWHIQERNDVGIGAHADMDETQRGQAAVEVRSLLQKRSAGRYTLVYRYNIGKKVEGEEKTAEVKYDSGYDIVPMPPEPAGDVK